MREVETGAPTNKSGGASQAWLRALELTAAIPRNRDRVLPTVIEEIAARSGEAPALLSDHESMTYRELAARSRQYSRWALREGLSKGDVVCLLMTNRPEYFAAWLGITRVGAVVSLLNTNLTGPSLAHCINVAQPRNVIVSSGFTDSLATALPSLTASPTIWVHGVDQPEFRRIDTEIVRLSDETLSSEEVQPLTIEDRALYIYTSGTTGLPKAANVSHARVMQWSHWFAGMMDAQPTDRMYNCLPMYHSVGGVQAIGAALVRGGSVVLRERFSTRHFWSDIIRWECTTFQYIGELCRYLLHANSSRDAAGHRIRVACGNGLAPAVWEEFKDRFQIPQILEFYAATEGGVSLFNAEGKPGSIGRVPPYLAHRFSPALVQFDVDKGEPVRNELGLCVKCAPNQIGEALGRVVNDPSAVGSRFEGYTDPNASQKRIVRDVLELGDEWIRTGDLMRKDEKGFFYFVDRVGDTFRWKGENVATSEVAEAICAFPGVKHANVYGVAIPGTEGRAGMATMVTADDTDLMEFRKYLIGRLPSYARPIFLRIRDEVAVTGTFKYSKTELVRQGYDPSQSADIIYFDEPGSQKFVRLDNAHYERIQSRQYRF
jgi:fatty-acyl-CoA synthase